MVTGGVVGGKREETDSTEVFDSDLGSWATSGALPRPMYGLRATNIAGRVLIFGNIHCCQAPYPLSQKPTSPNPNQVPISSTSFMFTNVKLRKLLRFDPHLTIT